MHVLHRGVYKYPYFIHEHLKNIYKTKELKKSATAANRQ